MRAAARVAIPRRWRSRLYAEAFESAGALDRLEGFASHFGADFYGLPRHGDKVTLEREPWIVPAEYPFGEHRVVPLRAGETVSWRVRPATPDAFAAEGTSTPRCYPTRPKPARPSPPG